MRAVDVLAREVDDRFRAVDRARPSADSFSIPLQAIDSVFPVCRAAPEHNDVVTLPDQDGPKRLADESAAAGENDAFHNGCRLSAAPP